MVSAAKKNLLKSHVASFARFAMAISFASLVFISVSHLVRAFSVETIEQINGIPANWGDISANGPETKLKSEIIDNKLVQYTSYLKNSDKSQAITLIKLASYLTDTTGSQKAGFLPLSDHNLEYTTTPKVESSWRTLAVKAPGTSEDGFALETPVRLAAAGNSGDTVYFRYFVRPEENIIAYTNTITYYTTDMRGGHNISYDYASNITSALEVKPRFVTVSYNVKDGTPIASETIARGSIATRPSDPVKGVVIDTFNSEPLDERFAGWTLDGVDYDFETPVMEDITLVARWEMVPSSRYLVSFDSNGGSSVPSQQLKYSTTATMPANPTKNGYKFVGWTLDGEPYDFSTAVCDDITLFANWEKVVYKVSFDARGGSLVDPQIIMKGDVATRPASALKNYKLVDWVDVNGKSYNFSTIVTEDITLYAVWEKKFFTVSFDSNGGSSVSAQVVKKGDSVIEPKIPTLEGYTFLGWTLGGSGYLFSTPVTSDITLTAHWEHTTSPITPEPSKNKTTKTAPVITTGSASPYIDPTASTGAIIDLANPKGAAKTASATSEEDMMYVPVLGEVAFVPDDSLITNLFANPFGNKSFGAAVLSRSYALANLAFFAASFYIFMAFRGFLSTGKTPARLPEHAGGKK